MANSEYLDIPDFLRNQDNLREENKVKAKPILFNSEMVRALLDGRKTQTRRLVDPQPQEHVELQTNSIGEHFADDFEGKLIYFKCPIGQVGDLLYVRETFAIYGDESQYAIHYRVDHPDQIGKDYGYKPSIHMPRWASRLTLKITDVRVERIQDITAGDARAEGHPCKHLGQEIDDDAARDWFQDLWNSMYKNWNENPYVFVINFEVVHKNVDEVLKEIQ